jgi:hypothetical protein
MQTDEVDVLALLEDVDELVELMLRDAELVLVETCGHILVGMCVNVRVDADGDISLESVDMCHLVNDIYLLK